MSCCGGDSDLNKVANQKVDKYLDSEKKQLDKTIKLLLLGAGESGKSTFFKQLRVIYLHGFSEDELLGVKSTVYINVVTSMKSLLGLAKLKNVQLNDQNQINAELVLSIQVDQEGLLNYNSKIGQAIKGLWDDKSIRELLLFRNEIQLLDSCEYFLENIDRINEDTYIPSLNDLLRCRVKTTGIISVEFELMGHPIKVVDVGGQRNERRKWMHCYDDSNCVLFMVSLIEYDLKCYEDLQTMRFDESLHLFEEICSNKLFFDTPILLLFNKMDIFQNKIKTVPLKKYDSLYEGPVEDVDASLEFIKQKFLSKNSIDTRRIDCFVVTSLITDDVSTIFQKIVTSILDQKSKQK